MLQSSESNAIRDVAQAEGMVSMRRNGIALVRAGITTFEEVMSATRDE
jgi:type II secretory ATPase GspE/PulE/Tfp pilus assembly ATPase PilB-like protein